METLQIIQACTAEHFAALSRIHALSWRSAYRCLLYVLRENGRARDFYEKHRFRWTGEAIDVPLPGTVCVDLRYLRTFSGRECL